MVLQDDEMQAVQEAIESGMARFERVATLDGPGPTEFIPPKAALPGRATESGVSNPVEAMGPLPVDLEPLSFGTTCTGTAAPTDANAAVATAGRADHAEVVGHVIARAGI